MTLTWWEWQEMEEAMLERGDLWEPVPERANMYFRVMDDQPAYVLMALPAPGDSQFRLVEVQTKPMNWPEDEVASHMTYMRDKFSSYPFRADVEAFLKDELKLDPKLAYQAAIIIARMQQGSLEQAPLPGDVSEPPPSLEKPAKFHVREGGVVLFRQQGEMLRCHMELSRPSVLRAMGGRSVLILDGFMRIRGTTNDNAMKFLLGEEPMPVMSEEDREQLLTLSLGEG